MRISHAQIQGLGREEAERKALPAVSADPRPDVPLGAGLDACTSALGGGVCEPLCVPVGCSSLDDRCAVQMARPSSVSAVRTYMGCHVLRTVTQDYCWCRSHGKGPGQERATG